MDGLLLLLLLLSSIVTDAAHFNGGTITWAPIDSYDNSSTVNISITQSYSWSYPTVTCTTNVPISTGTYSSSNANLTCVSDCSTDGGYSTAPVNILTDCVSYSVSLGMMSSERPVNITLNAGAYFYVSYTGSAWRRLNDPPESGLSWSILSFIDLRVRPDGIINTPPVATVVSPQYVIVNTTNQIEIPVSDVNAGDDVRCRWSIYRAGYRRRRLVDEYIPVNSELDNEINQYLTVDGDVAHRRKKRQGCSSCNSNTCWQNCRCSCSACDSTTCNRSRCTSNPFCPVVTTTTQTTLPTSSFLHPPIDECGGICYPSGLPNDTTLSNCTLSFTGLIPDTWYAISLQVEDFINDTSTVPVQFLIYVLPTPTCSVLPLMLPLTSCLQFEVGVAINVTLYAMNLCGSTVDITDIIVSKGITGMVAGNILNSTTNSSLVYVTYTWTPQTNQIGAQEMCTIAFNTLFVQSTQYCVTFTVTSSTPNCTITTVASAAVTAAPSTKPSSNINIPLIVGLSLAALLMALTCCCCLFYHLCWSAAARRRREKQQKDGVRPQKYFLSNPILTAGNFSLKTPSKSYVIHNISDNRDSTYTVQSGISTTFSSSLKNRMLPTTINNSKKFDTEKTSNLDQSFTEEYAPFQSSDRQSIDNISLPLYSTTRTNKASKSAAKERDDVDISTSPNIHVTKLPRSKKSAVHNSSKSDDNRGRKSIDTIAALTNAVVDNSAKLNDVQLEEDAIPKIRKTKIVKVQLADSQNRRRSGSIGGNVDNQGFTEEYAPRKGSVSVVKLKRLPDKRQKSKDHNNTAFSENNGKMTSDGVTVVPVPRKQSKSRSRSSGHRKSAVDIIEMS